MSAKTQTNNRLPRELGARQYGERPDSIKNARMALASAPGEGLGRYWVSVLDKQGNYDSQNFEYRIKLGYRPVHPKDDPLYAHLDGDVIMHDGLILMENTSKLIQEYRDDNAKRFQIEMESIEAATRDDPSYVRLQREKSFDLVERRSGGTEE